MASSSSHQAGVVWRSQWASLSAEKQATALSHAIKVHLHASGAVVREVRRPVLAALQKILRDKFRNAPGPSNNSSNSNSNSNSNNNGPKTKKGPVAIWRPQPKPFAPKARWTLPKPGTTAFNNLVEEAPKTRNPASMKAAVQLYTLITKQVRELCPLGQDNNAALGNNFTNDALWGNESNSIMYVVLQYDQQKKSMVAKGVAVVEPADPEKYAGTLRQMAVAGTLADVALVCGSGGGGELALLAALSKLATAKQNHVLKYKAVVVEAAHKGTFAAAKRAWKTDKTKVPIGNLLASYGFEPVPDASRSPIALRKNQLEVILQGADWRYTILEKLLAKRYGAQDSMEGICPITTGQGLTYCF